MTDVDRYDRLVVRCTVNGRDLVATLVSEGMVIADPTYGREYRDEEAAARRVMVVDDYRSYLFTITR